ncbi:uncharacterized protein METZ01_LOCUS340473, partial [marine metagenome]
ARVLPRGHPWSLHLLSPRLPAGQVRAQRIRQDGPAQPGAHCPFRHRRQPRDLSHHRQDQLALVEAAHAVALLPHCAPLSPAADTAPFQVAHPVPGTRPRGGSVRPGSSRGQGGRADDQPGCEGSDAGGRRSDAGAPPVHLLRLCIRGDL